MCKILENLHRMWKGKVGWVCHEDEYNEEVKGLLMEFKKVLKVKVEEALGTEEQIEEIEKVDPDDNLENEIETEKVTEIEEECEKMKENIKPDDEVEREKAEPSDNIEAEGVEVVRN